MRCVLAFLTLLISGCSMVAPVDREFNWSCTSHDLINYLENRQFDKRQEILIMNFRYEEIKDGVACQFEFVI